LQHPVIILLDNDEGARGTFGLLKQKNFNISHKTIAPFYRITKNLYIVKTPESDKETAYSQIEELFDTSTLASDLNGKTFNMSNKSDSATHYGKKYFAEYVVARKINKIDFEGFGPLLDRIVATISDYKSVVAAGAV
jgi:hypothetical protein